MDMKEIDAELVRMDDESATLHGKLESVKKGLDALAQRRNVVLKVRLDLIKAQQMEKLFPTSVSVSVPAAQVKVKQ